MVRSVTTLISGLSRDHAVSLICPRGAEIARTLRQESPAVAIRECLGEWVIDWRRPLATAKTLLAVSAELFALRQSGGALIVTNNVGAELLALGCGRIGEPRLFVARGGDYRGVSARFLRQALRGDLALVSTTAAHKAKLAVLGGERVAAKTTVIWNGIDVRPLHALPATGIGRGQGDIRVGVIGFPSERKNQLLLVEAAALLRAAGCANLRYSFFGAATSRDDEIYEGKVRQRIAELGLESCFAWRGYVDSPVELYAEIDIVVSTALEEGFGRTIVEAMAAGRPVIALRCSGGPAELIRHGDDGLLIENSPEALAAALEGLVRDLPCATEMAWRGRARAAADFTDERYVDNYRRLIARLKTSLLADEI